VAAELNHPSFLQPENQGVPLWRYMDLSRFLRLLQQRALYFCRLDSFDDPYEGYFTEPTANAFDLFVAAILDAGPMRPDSRSFINIVHTPGQMPLNDGTLRERFADILQSVKVLRLRFFVNCWHINEEESHAMWRLYTALDEAVCIKTTYQNPGHQLPPECSFGCVRYENYRTHLMSLRNDFEPVMHKRESYRHEREARAVV